MLIGIAGRKQHGKSTTASYIHDTYNYTIHAFADILKTVCHHVFDFTDDQLYGNAKEVVDPYWLITPRYAMQTIGTDMFRKCFGEDIWIRIFNRKVSCLQNVVISDVRYQNEVDYIHNNGGIVINIIRTTADNYISDHESETQILQCDYTVYNDGSIEELYKKISNIIEHLIPTISKSA
jgi:hypothetical protein